MKTLPTGLSPEAYRASGIALDISALPSRYGIGDIGPTALRWIDSLSEAGQSWWHAFESCNSIYYSHPSFALNPLLISPDWLVEDGLLNKTDCEHISFGSENINFDVVVPFKRWLVEKTWARFNSGVRKDLAPSFDQFRRKQAHWLDDYALFHALRARYRGDHWQKWPAGLVRRDPSALTDVRQELANHIEQERFSQFLLFRQMHRLKEYAGERGVSLIGDYSIVVSDDSSEAWSNRDLFVSAVGKDASARNFLVPFCFNPNNTLIRGTDAKALRRVSYRWCVDRLRALLSHVDVAHVHLPAYAAAPHVSVGAAETQSAAFQGIGYLSNGHLITDYLVSTTQELEDQPAGQLIDTRVLQCAVYGGAHDLDLTRKAGTDSVLYTGRGDSRIRGWFDALSDEEQQRVWDLLKRPPGESAEVALEVIRLAWSSKAAISIVSVPDLLNLGSDQPGAPVSALGHNRWACSEEMLTAPVFCWLRELTRDCKRSVDANSRVTVDRIQPPQPHTGAEAAL